MNKDIIYASHLQTREELMKMQNLGGAMIMPLVLYKVLVLTLPKEERHIEKSERIIRDSVYTFCALCNEYYIFNRHAKHPKTEFYISNGRWEKYHISKATIERSLEFLTICGLITWEMKKIPPKGNCERVYKINLEILLLYTKASAEIIEGTTT